MAPKRYERRKKQKAWSSFCAQMTSDTRPTLNDEDMKTIEESIQKTCGWQSGLHSFQLAGIKAQLEGVDTIVQALQDHISMPAVAESALSWLSLLFNCNKKWCVKTFKDEFKLNAIAINSKNGAMSPLVVNEILSGKYQIILASPEMLQSQTFINRILRNTGFARKVLSLFVDEAHCISHWGANFRKKYNTLGIIRAFLPRDVPAMAVTATLTPKVCRDIQSKLHFPKSGSVFLNVGNDRPNVSMVVRSCEHPAHTFADLDFVIPANVESSGDIPKTFIYVDDINQGGNIIDHLNDILRSRNKQLADTGLIRPFNATMSHEYREKAMECFRDGTICILVCTDAAGMGCNIPDIDVVVQWQLPATLSNWIQRAGRAARGHGRTGLAVLLVEPSAYGLDPTKSPSKTNVGTKNQHKVKRPTMPDVKQYAMEHGLKRGGSNCDDAIPTGDQPELNTNCEDEGLLAFVQSTQCRRKIQLQSWREHVYARDYCDSQLDPTALLDDPTIEFLSSIGPLSTDGMVESLLRDSWIWWDIHGAELVSFLETLTIVYQPKPRKPRKRKEVDECGGDILSKRARTDSEADEELVYKFVEEKPYGFSTPPPPPEAVVATMIQWQEVLTPSDMDAGRMADATAPVRDREVLAHSVSPSESFKTNTPQAARLELGPINMTPVRPRPKPRIRTVASGASAYPSPATTPSVEWGISPRATRAHAASSTLPPQPRLDNLVRFSSEMQRPLTPSPSPAPRASGSQMQNPPGALASAALPSVSLEAAGHKPPISIPVAAPHQQLVSAPMRFEPQRSIRPGYKATALTIQYEPIPSRVVPQQKSPTSNDSTRKKTGNIPNSMQVSLESSNPTPYLLAASTAAFKVAGYSHAHIS
ncbi:hypothetical protein K474DRAFT_1709611 [Panus rudis PR-1116 ss-1]|nr:hypothetical protein K474DRAFT_1709611 [Panus rudis PR-1116 ss-1]